MRTCIIILSLLGFLMDMENNSFEQLLDKNISEITIDGIKPKKVKNTLSNFSIFFENPIDYHNKNVYFIFFTTDENEKIIRINLSLISIIDKPFFDSMVNQYGEPTNILIVDEVIESNDKKLNSESQFNQYTKKRFLKTKEGTFEENPLSIIWKKDEFQIDVFIKEKQNKTTITFTKK